MDKARSNDQNRLMWAMLKDISKQVVWDGNKYSSEEWKDLFTATVFGVKLVRSLDGSDTKIAIGRSTKDLPMISTEEEKGFDALIMTMEVFGAEYGVKFTAPNYYEEWV